jgi:hypothetical protein
MEKAYTALYNGSNQEIVERQSIVHVVVHLHEHAKQSRDSRKVGEAAPAAVGVVLLPAEAIKR